MFVYTFFEKLKNNTKLIRSAVATSIMFLIAYGYSYFNSSFVVDRFSWFDSGWNGGYYFKSGSYAVTGKWFNQYLGILNWTAYLPWLNGVLTILFAIIAVYYICLALKIERTLSIWLVAGLVATDASILWAHFFFPYVYTAALFLICLSLWSWSNQSLPMVWRIILGAIAVCLSFGTYGSYTSVGLSVVVLCCMIMLLEGDSFKKVFNRGIEYFVTFVIGMVLYYVIMRLYLVVLDLEMISYMGEDKLMNGVQPAEVLHYIDIAYKNSILRYIGDFRTEYRFTSGVSLCLVILGIGLLVWLAYRGGLIHIKQKEFWLFIVLAGLFPLSVGSIYVMAFGVVHQLMTFSYVVFYIGLVKLVEMALTQSVSEYGTTLDAVGQDTVVRTLCSNKFRYGILQTSITLVLVLSAFLVYRGVVVSNMTFSRLDNLHEISCGIVDRLVGRIEACDGFTADETIYFVGDITESDYFRYSRNHKSWELEILDGNLCVNKDASNSFIYPTQIREMIKENTNIRLDIEYYDEDADEPFTDSDKAVIDSMPEYPAAGSIRKIGEDAIVVCFAH